MLNKKILPILACLLYSHAWGQSAAIDPITPDLPPLPEEVEPIPDDPLAAMNRTIKITKQNYENQVDLKKGLLRFMKIKKQFLEQPEDKSLLYQLIRAATQVDEKINDTHLSHAIDPRMLLEIKRYSNTESALEIPPP